MDTEVQEKNNPPELNTAPPAYLPLITLSNDEGDKDQSLDFAGSDFLLGC